MACDIVRPIHLHINEVYSGKSFKVASVRVVESSGTLILEVGIIWPLGGMQGFLKLIAEILWKFY